MLLRTRLSIIMAAGFAVLALLLDGVGGLKAELMQQRLASTMLAGEAVLWQQAVDDETVQLQRVLDYVAKDEAFGLAAALDDDASAREALRAAGIDTQADGAPASLIAVFNANREPLILEGRNPGTQILDATSFDRVLDGAETSGLRQGASGEPFLLAARPLRLSGGTGVLVVGRSAQGALKRIAPPDGLATLVSLRSKLMATTDPALWERVQPKVAPRIASLTETEHDGRTFFLAVTPVQDIAGGAAGALVTMVDVTASQSASRQLSRWANGGTLALVLLGVVALNVYLWRSFRPLQSAIDALQALSRGDANVRLDVRGTDEIGRIGQAVAVFRRDVLELASNRALRDRVRRRQESVIRRELLTLAQATGSTGSADPDKAQQALPAVGDATRSSPAPGLPVISAAGAAEASVAPAAPVDGREDNSLRRLAQVMGGLTGRIIEQHQSLTGMVVELREALHTKTQLVAIQQELEIARKMQRAILPRAFEARGGLVIAGTMTPAREIGGDFFDYFEIDEHRIAITVADVSGKGVPAALFMAVSRTLLRAVARLSTGPADCLARLNALLAADNEQMMFVTLFYMVIDTRDGSAVYANAGHNPPYVLRGNGDIEPIPATQGMALAILAEAEFEDVHLMLAPGDGIFLYTDGVTESFDPKRTMFGAKRLEMLLAQLRDCPVDEVPKRVEAEVMAFEAGGPRSDDVTCLMTRWRAAR